MSPGSPEFSSLVSLFAAAISAVGATVALLSVFMTRKNWRDSNRPVLTAYLHEESGGAGITVFNLCIKNTGTRPAASVHLTASFADIARIIADQADPKRRHDIERIFSKDSRITVLHPYETLVTSFGLASTDPSHQWLNYGEELEVKIAYCDLERRRYSSVLPLCVRPREGFGGGAWKSAT